MKKYLSKLFFAAMFLATTLLCAQAPNSFNYQAVLRNASGDLITGQLVEMRFTVRNGSASGTVQFQETKTVTPNEFGLVNHAIGTGSVVAGTFVGITWGTGTKFLQVELNEGTGFVNLGAQQMVSVPYALNAASATSSLDNHWSIFASNQIISAGHSVRVGSQTASIRLYNTGEAGSNSHIDAQGGAGGLFLNHYSGSRVVIGGGLSSLQPVATFLMSERKVGIETSTPAYELEVNGSAGKPGGGSWTATSDSRLKKNVSSYTDGLNSILNIEPVRFQYNEKSGVNQEKVYVGVIAQDLKEVASYMVGTFEKDGETYFDVDNSAMTYMLINAVKEQQAQIEELKQMVLVLSKK
jgi:hypothetical protein